MAKSAKPRYEPEPQPAEATNDDILSAVRRLEKFVHAIAEDIVQISEDIDAIYITIPKTQLPPNDGPAPPEPPAPESVAEAPAA